MLRWFPHAEALPGSTPGGQAQMNPAVLQLRVMQGAFIVSVLLFFVVIRTLPPSPVMANPTLQWAIVSAAILSAISGFVVQRMILRAASHASAPRPYPILLRQWMTGHLFRFATAESVALFGVVLNRLGGPSAFVYALFGAGLLLLLLWQPGAVPTQSQSAGFICRSS
jgi:hypothetical protein